MRKIEWTNDAVDSLNEILVYYKDNAGDNVAIDIYNRIIKEIDILENEKLITKQTQELKDIGIFDVYEATIAPWKVYYKLKDNNKKAYILFVLDTRRNIEEILISKVIDNKI